MILVAPTSFKGTHSATAAAAAMAAGARAVYRDDVLVMPVSDGGPGLIESLQHAAGGDVRTVQVSGPLGTPVSARILIQNATAYVESADACGLHLVAQEQRNPLLTTSFGVGELLLAAASYAADVVIGLGGSATVDGGIGAARALGWQLRGSSLLDFSAIEARPKAQSSITALADVANPLFGPDGAAHVFAPQKGAAAADVEVLDSALRRMADIIARDIGIDVAGLVGGGAAGGLGAGLHAFANARLISGSEWMLDRLRLDELLQRADAVITGEGRYDAQSGMGKITGTIAARAAAAGVPCLVIAGRAGQPLLSLTDITERARQEVSQLLAQRGGKK